MMDGLTNKLSNPYTKIIDWIKREIYDPGSGKSRIYVGKSTKRRFSKKALTEFEKYFLF